MSKSVYLLLGEFQRRDLSGSGNTLNRSSTTADQHSPQRQLSATGNHFIFSFIVASRMSVPVSHKCTTENFLFLLYAFSLAAEHRPQTRCLHCLTLQPRSHLPTQRLINRSSKNANFPTPLSVDASGVNPMEFLDEPYRAKTGVFGLSVGENFLILACVVSTQCQSVTDAVLTDRRTTRRWLIKALRSKLC